LRNKKSIVRTIRNLWICLFAEKCCTSCNECALSWWNCQSPDL